MLKAIVVVAALVASLAVLAWSPKLAVVRVDVFGQGLEERTVIPERQGSEGGKDGKEHKWVTPEKTTIHPRKAVVVVAHLGRLDLGLEVHARIPGETRPITIEVDWTRVFAEWALIAGCAAFVLGLMSYREELPVQKSVPTETTRKDLP